MVDAWHSNIGAAILENWEIPEAIRNAVQNFGIKDYEHFGSADLTDIIIASDMLDANFETDSNRKINWEQLPSALLRLNLNEEISTQVHKQSHIELGLILGSIT